MIGSTPRRRRAALAVTALALGIAAACRSTDSSTPSDGLAPGDALLTTGTNELRIAGGTSGGEFVFVVADTATTQSTPSAFQVTASGIGSAGAVSAPASSLSPLSDLVVSGSMRSAPTMSFDIAARLNARANTRLRPLFQAARAPLPSGLRRSTSTTPPAVGDIVTYNVSSNACDSIVDHPTRIVAIGSKAIVAVDTLDPPNSWTTADYQRFAANFDTLVYPLDVANFGAPTDIDQNGHVVLLFTRAVNDLTPPNSDAFTGGFFFDRDLFPTTGTPDVACPGSNYAEMFYLLAPDPAGSINGNARTTGFVDSLVTPLIGHEFQHLINASRRLFVNNANDFEVVWLNEGLSHIAEELLFYRVSGLSPRQNIGATTFHGNTRAVDAFNEDQSSNTGRYEEYLKKPSTSSPIRDDDSLSTRGATWDFLRYSADRKVASAGTDADVWQALVNSTTTGMANLRNVFGSDIGGMLRDWSVSQYTDDVVTNESVEYTQPSWNWHSIFPALQGGGSYPLVVTSMAPTGASGSVIPGGAAFYRFSVPANGLATLTLGGSGGGTIPVQGVVVRLR